MNTVTLLCVAYTAVCATFAAVHFSIWLRDRRSAANLGFSMLAIGVAGMTVAELAMARAETPEAIGTGFQWTHVSILVIVAGMVVFVHSYLGRGRVWLAYIALGVRLVLIPVTFLRPQGADLVHLPRVERVPFLGETLSVAVGPVSAWHWFAQGGFVALVAYVLDASFAVWRRGGEHRRRGITIGGSTAAFAILGPIWAAASFTGALTLPHVEFFFFLPLVVAMAAELGDDVLRAARLTGELQVQQTALRESERRMALAVETAGLGMWVREMPANTIWMSDRCRAMFGFEHAEAVTYERLAARVHPADRATWHGAVTAAEESGELFAAEFRLRLPDGTVRWIVSRGQRGEEAGRLLMRGVCLDVTPHRVAELAARDLSGRLINAQEDERRRVARELHDDLSQRLALLAIEVDALGREQPALHADEPGGIASTVREVAAEVHRIAYQLHPAKLEQVGLEAALGSLCRDLGRQSKIAIEFESARIPPDLRRDVALCVYRVAQESLRNAIRHSGTSWARVEVRMDGASLRLRVADRGRGLDARQPRGGLGLVSMRERVRLVNGTLAVRSGAGDGTVVEISVPLDPVPLEMVSTSDLVS